MLAKIDKFTELINHAHETLAFSDALENCVWSEKLFLFMMCSQVAREKIEMF